MATFELKVISSTDSALRLVVSEPLIGHEGDNNFNKFHLDSPADMEVFTPFLEIVSKNGSYSLEFDYENELLISSEFTNVGEALIQVVYVTQGLSTTVIGKTNVVPIRVGNSINATENLPEDSKDIVYNLYNDAFVAASKEDNHLNFFNSSDNLVTSIVLPDGLTGDFVEPPTDPTLLSAQYLGQWFDIGGSKYERYVDPNSPHVKEDGSAYFPFKRIQSALVDNIVVNLSNNTYPNDVRFTNAHNQLIRGTGAIGQRYSVITGDVIVDEQSDNIGVQNVHFQGQANINSVLGNVHFDNCYFDSLTVGVLSEGTYIFDFCEFASDVQIFGNARVIFRNCDFGATGIIYQRQEGSRIDLTACTNVTLNHLEGAFVCYTATFKSFGANYAISSTASAANSVLALFGGTTFRVSGEFSTINKTGSCRYVIGPAFHHSSADTFNGERIGVGAQTDTITHLGAPIQDYLDKVTSAFAEMGKIL